MSTDPHDPGTRDLEDCLNEQHRGGYVANQLAPLHDALDRLARYRIALNHWRISYSSVYRANVCIGSRLCEN